jgi:hypothetical protein
MPSQRQSRKHAKPPLVIGWKEYVEFPEWGVEVKAKIDTGARTSVIDVSDYRLYQDPGQRLMAELRLPLDRKHPDRLAVIHAPVLRMVTVTSSGGHKEQRPVISAAIRLGPVVKDVLLTVTDRASMLFRMLLGRKALEDDFIVDVSKRYLMKATRRRGDAGTR